MIGKAAPCEIIRDIIRKSQTGNVYTYHPSGVEGDRRGIGSVAVIFKQWYRQSAGRCTLSCHFFETCVQTSVNCILALSSEQKEHMLLTDSTPSSSHTLRCLKILNTKSGARLPTMSNVDFAYFSRSRICRRISPGMHESRIMLIL